MRWEKVLLTMLLCVPFAVCQQLYGQKPSTRQSRFDLAVACVKYFEGWHTHKDYPYVGYGHKLLPGERFTADISERQADSLLRADIAKRYVYFRYLGKDALLVTVLSYNVGVGSLLGHGKRPKSRLVRKLEMGDRDVYREYVSFCRYKGKVLRGLVRRRQVEFALFYEP